MNAALCATVIFAAMLRAMGPDAGAGDFTREELVRILDRTSATYAIHHRSLLFERNGAYTTCELAGFDVRQRERLVVSAIPAVQVGTPFEFVAYWRALGVLQEDLRMHLRIEGSGPILQFETPVDTSVWQVGVVSKANYPWTIPWLSYSGRGDLDVSVSWSEGDSEVRATAKLYAGPVFVTPAATRSAVSEDLLQKVFGVECVRLNTAFRLGRGASLAIAVPASVRTNVRAIGLVSSLAYVSGVADDVEVCEVNALFGGTEIPLSARLLNGVTTLQTDVDLYDPGTAARSGVSIFSSSDSDRRDASGQALQRHAYAAEIPLESAGPIDTINFRYVLADGIIVVDEIVLIP